MSLQHEKGSEVSKIIQEAQFFVSNHKDLKQKLLEAKEAYQKDTGRIKETYPDFEHRIGAFLHWFLFDLDFKGDNPFRLFVESKNLDETKKDEYTKLSVNHHSIFEFLKVKNDKAFVYDLFERKKFIVENPYWLTGIEKGEIFESRDRKSVV